MCREICFLSRIRALFVLSVCAIGIAAAAVASAQSGVVPTRSQFPAFSGGVPVLLYHRLVAEPNAVAPADFAAQMQRLHDAGFQAITLETYLRFVRGERVALPRRPILITFDDGYLSSWHEADPVLARYGWSAVMYIPTGFVGLPGHLTWGDLRVLQASPRWRLEEHAGFGHVEVVVDAQGRRLPFYTAERWLGSRRETFAEYKRRVSDDLALGARMLEQHLPGWQSLGTFAVPFGAYGQRGSNDPRIEPWFATYLRSHFTVSFVQRIDRFSTPGTGLANRIAVSGTWGGGGMLQAHLLRGAALLARSP